MAYIYDLSDAWSVSGATYTGIKLNVTDSGPSSASSLLMDLQVGGVSKFSVDKNSNVTANQGLFAAQVVVGIAFSVTSSGVLRLPVSGNIGFTPTGAAGSVADLILARDAANTLAQRNGVNAQAFNLYNTYTDASNYERGFMRFASNTMQVGSEKLGTGTARDLSFQTDGTARMTVAATTGAIRLHNLGNAAVPSLYWNTIPGTFTNWGFFSVGVGSTSFATGNTEIIRFGGAVNGMCVYDTYAIGTNFGAPNIFLRDEGAGTLAQRNGTNAQTDRLYGTYTDASNYRRLTKTMSTAGVAEIKPEGAGTGASGNVLHISGLPTSNPGPGILWNNAGTPAIGT